MELQLEVAETNEQTMLLASVSTQQFVLSPLKSTNTTHSTYSNEAAEAASHSDGNLKSSGKQIDGGKTVTEWN